MKIMLYWEEEYTKLR